MTDIFNDVWDVVDYSDFITDSKLQAGARRLIQGTYGHYSRSIKTGAYAATATNLYLQIDDTTDVPVTSGGNSVQTFNVLYYDNSNPSDEKYFWWQELTATDPGDGSLALQLGSANLYAQSHTLGTGASEFSLANASETYFRVFVNATKPNVEVYADNYASLSAAITAVENAGGGTVVIRKPEDYPVSADDSISDGVSVDVRAFGATITIASGQTLTVDDGGVLDLTSAGKVAGAGSLTESSGAVSHLPTIRQCFDVSAGLTVTLNNSSVDLTPKMFGAKGDGTTDDKTAIEAMFAAWLRSGVTKHNILFTPGTYAVSGQIVVTPTAATTGGKIIGHDAEISMTGSDHYGLVFHTFGTGGVWYKGHIMGLKFLNCGLRIVSGDRTNNEQFYGWVLDKVEARVASEHGIHIVSAFEIALNDCLVWLDPTTPNNHGSGIRCTNHGVSSSSISSIEISDANCRYGKHNVRLGTSAITPDVPSANVNTSTDTFTSTSHGLESGDRVQLTTTGTLPSPLGVATDYWVTRVDDDSFKLSSSVPNWINGTYIDVATQGSGTHTFTVQAEVASDTSLIDGTYLLAYEQGIIATSANGVSIITPHVENAWRSSTGGPSIYVGGDGTVMNPRVINGASTYADYAVEGFTSNLITVIGGTYSDSAGTMVADVNCRGGSGDMWVLVGVGDFDDNMADGGKVVAISRTDGGIQLSGDATLKTAVNTIMPVGAPGRWCEEFNDFTSAADYDTTNDWAETTHQNSGSGDLTVGVVADTQFGILILQNDDGDDDAVSVQKTAGALGEIWRIESGKDLYFEARIRLNNTIQQDAFAGLAITSLNLPAGLGVNVPVATDSIGVVTTDEANQLKLVCRKDSTETVEANLGQAVNDTWYNVGFKVTGGTSVQAYIDGVAVGSAVTTNIPDDENLCVTFACQNGESASKYMDVDYYHVMMER